MEKDFTKYEYVNVTILKSLAGLCRESYEAFGWEVMGNTRGKDECIHMRRSRNVRERNRLMAEQRKMEDALMAIEKYEQKKESDTGDVRNYDWIDWCRLADRIGHRDILPTHDTVYHF